MNYFVTGATGFIGRNLVSGCCSARARSTPWCGPARAAGWRSCGPAWGADGARVVPIAGDLAQPGLGVSEEDLLDAARRGRPLLPPGGDLRHDRRRRGAGDRQRRGHPPRGRARRRDRGRLLPPGQLDRRRRPLQGRVARGHVRRGRTARHPSLLPHQARVRAGRARGVPAALARLPAGDRRRRLAHAARSTRSTGPTTSSRLLQRARRVLPAWLPTVGVEGGEINIVPVDYVADAIDHIAHKPDLDGQAFHLTDPNPKTAGEVINLFAQAADAPQMTLRLDSDVTEPATGAGADRRCSFFPPAKRAAEAGAGPARHPGRRPHLRRLPDPASTRPRRRRRWRARGSRCRRWRATRTGSGTTGSATSTPTCSRTAR